MARAGGVARFSFDRDIDLPRGALVAAARAPPPARCDGVRWKPPYLLVEVLVGHGGVAALRLSWLGLTRSGPSVAANGEVGEARL